jgi:hypothetical protein
MAQSKKIRICGDLKAFQQEDFVSPVEYTSCRKTDEPELSDQIKDLEMKLPQEIAA